jgi:hypothetical protein
MYLSTLIIVEDSDFGLETGEPPAICDSGENLFYADALRMAL